MPPWLYLFPWLSTLKLLDDYNAIKIGAGGLGYDVLIALRRLNTGEGMLAGTAIVVCAMILDRIVQGRRSRRRARPLN